MKRPTEEDFKMHALGMLIHSRAQTNLEAMSEGIKFGYQLALRHAADEVEAAVKDLKEFRENNNKPK